MGQEYYVNS